LHGWIANIILFYKQVKMTTSKTKKEAMKAWHNDEITLGEIYDAGFDAGVASKVGVDKADEKEEQDNE